ncbi:YbhB/YbcL family Raf kinase inhibitor-like protein [Mycoplasma sp. Z386]
MNKKNKRTILFSSAMLLPFSYAAFVACSQTKIEKEGNTTEKEPTNPGNTNGGNVNKEPGSSNEVQESAMGKITVTSSGITNGFLNEEYAAKQDPNSYSTTSYGKSLPLSWNKVENAKSYAVVLVDKTATEVMGRIFTHWGVFDIPATTTSLEENYSVTQQNNSEIKQIINSNDQMMEHNASIYFGPLPPTEHIYEVRVFALSEAKLNVKSNLDKYYLGDFYDAIKDKTIAEGVLTFVYEQHPSVKSNGNLYASNEVKKLEIKSNAIQNNMLNTGYFSTSTSNDLSQLKTFGLSWNKIKEAQSYMYWIEDYSPVKTKNEAEYRNKVKILGGKINIENPAVADKMFVSVGEQYYNDQETSKNILNSTFELNFDVHNENANRDAQKILLPKKDGDGSQNLYIIRVVALNKKLIKYNKANNNDPHPTHMDEHLIKDSLGSYLLQAKGSIIAEGSLIFKLV